MRKLIYIILCTTLLFSCKKDISKSEYAKSLLSEKTWYLDNIIQNNQTISFVGKHTYFIQFSKSGNTSDSDGLKGNYTIEENNHLILLIIKASTQNGILAEYQYQIEQIGSDHLIVSYQKEDSLIKKTFSITH